jgi:hypothetical protein
MLRRTREDVPDVLGQRKSREEGDGDTMTQVNGTAVPEELRRKLRDRGHRFLEVTDARIDLASGDVTREVILDRVRKGKTTRRDLEIDWDEIARLVDARPPESAYESHDVLSEIREKPKPTLFRGG